MDRTQALLTKCMTVLAALTAMTLSYYALAQRAAEAGFAWPLNWLLPLSVDGMLVNGIVAAYVLRSARLRTRLYVWCMVSVGLSVSLAGNAFSASGYPLAFVFRAWPPLALALCLHVLIILTRGTEASTPQALVDALEDERIAEQARSLRPPAPRRAARGQRSPSGEARALVAAARAEGRSLSGQELARQTGLTASSARRILAEEQSRTRVSASV